MHPVIGDRLCGELRSLRRVRPIVRHHHENWNGTGYPTGMKGTDIPIGARILSVVDCFDALTSDRPYRPRLSDDDAIAVLLERRGTMYDPLVVDTFNKVHQDIAPAHRDHFSPASERLFFERAAQCLTGTLLLIVLQTHLVLSGDLTYTADVTTWAAPSLRLPVKDHTVGKGTYGAFPFSFDATEVMRSVNPA